VADVLDAETPVPRGTLEDPLGMMAVGPATTGAPAEEEVVELLMGNF